MVLIPIFFSIFSWGQGCYLNESHDSFKIQCQQSQAQWKEYDAHKAQVKIQLPQNLKIDLNFVKKLNGDFIISNLDLIKGQRLQAWLTDQDLYHINQLFTVANTIGYQSQGFRTFKQSLQYVLQWPIYEILDDLSVASKRQVNAGYSMICKYIGKKKRGYFAINGKKKSKRVRVGRRKSDCYGRCGFGCGFDNQYTQECLNHDVCNRVTGENLGVCSDEFWAASDGFFAAPDCE